MPSAMRMPICGPSHLCWFQSSPQSASIIAVSIAFGRPTFSFRSVFANVSEGFVFSLSGSTTYIYNDLDKVMLGHYGMNAANGIYTTAYRILNICTTPITSIHNAAYPAFLSTRRSRGKSNGAVCQESVAENHYLWSRRRDRACFSPLPSSLISWVRASAESVLALRWLCLIPLFRCFHLSARRCHGRGRLPELQTGHPPLRSTAKFWSEFDFDTQVLLAGRCMGQPGDGWRPRGVGLDRHPLAHFKREE